MTERVLLTGGTGFFGRRIADALRRFQLHGDPRWLVSTGAPSDSTLTRPLTNGMWKRNAAAYRGVGPPARRLLRAAL